MKWMGAYYYQIGNQGMQSLKIGGVSDRRKDGVDLAE